jgi:hypothetical protein
LETLEVGSDFKSDSNLSKQGAQRSIGESRNKKAEASRRQANKTESKTENKTENRKQNRKQNSRQSRHKKARRIRRSGRAGSGEHPLSPQQPQELVGGWGPRP